VCRLQVLFINDQSGEYQYYEIQFRAVRPGVMATIKLSTTVRQRRPHTLTVDNPLMTGVNFTASCNVADLQIPSQMSVAAQSQVLLGFIRRRCVPFCVLLSYLKRNMPTTRDTFHSL